MKKAEFWCCFPLAFAASNVILSRDSNTATADTTLRYIKMSSWEVRQGEDHLKCS